MPRLLFMLAVIAIVWWLWRNHRLPGRGPRPASGREITTVRCQLCGVHVPQQQALQSHGHWYCSAQHLQQAEHSHSG